MIVRPAAGIDPGPEVGLIWARDANGDLARKGICGLCNSLVENAGDFDGPVAALAKQGQRFNSGEGAHLMEYLRSPIAKEALDCIQSGGPQSFEEAKAECLGAGRFNAIEDRVSSAAFDPRGSAVRRMP